MYSVLQSLLELATFVTSIDLMLSGFSSEVKYSSIEYIRKRNMIFGIILLILAIIVGLPDMYHGFVNGWNAWRK